MASEQESLRGLSPNSQPLTYNERRDGSSEKSCSSFSDQNGISSSSHSSMGLSKLFYSQKKLKKTTFVDKLNSVFSWVVSDGGGNNSSSNNQTSVKRKRVLWLIITIVIMPIMLATMLNQWSSSVSVKDLNLASQQWMGSYTNYLENFNPMQKEKRPPGERRVHNVMDLLGKSESPKEDSINVLLPDFLKARFEKIYLEKLKDPLSKVYNKTVHFDSVPMSEWLDVLKNDVKKRSMSKYDMYAMVSTLLPTYVEQHFVKDLTDYLTDLPSIYWDDVLPQIRELATYNNKVYMLPADGDVILMMYNDRILKEHGMNPPDTWEEWIAISKELHGKDLNGDGVPDAGSCVVTEANGFYAPLFFAFAAPFLQTYGSEEGIFFDAKNMKPRFGSPGYHHILELYKEMVTYSLHSMHGPVEWDIANQWFLEEKCALIYNFHGMLKLIGPDMDAEVAKTYTLKMIPGTKIVLSEDGKGLEECDEQRCPHADSKMVNRAPFYGEGGIGLTINAYAKNDIIEAATSFAVSMTGPENSLPLVTSPSAFLDPYRYSHFRDVGDINSKTSAQYLADGWHHSCIQRWKDMTIKAFEHPNGVKDLAIFGKAQYTGEYGFETVVTKFLTGQYNGQEASAQLNKAWERLTSQYGKYLQLKIYRKSLDLPTSQESLPKIAMSIAAISLLGLVWLIYNNRKLSRELDIKTKQGESLERISKWTSLVSNDPASRLMSALRSIQDGKKPDPEEITDLISLLRHKGDDIWKPNLNTREFEEITKDNKAFADYLQFNLLKRRSSKKSLAMHSSSNHIGQSFNFRSRSFSSSSYKPPSAEEEDDIAEEVPDTTTTKKQAKSTHYSTVRFRDAASGVKTSPYAYMGRSDTNSGHHYPDGWVAVEKLHKVKNAGKWDLDPFQTSTLTGGHPMLALMYSIFQKETFLSNVPAKFLLQELDIDEEKLWRYLQVIESGMDKKNVYHNACHVCDVLNNMYWMLTEGELIERLQLTPMEVFAALFAAYIHDFDHPGVSNEFLIRTGHERAILYNNQSVNENWHVAKAFTILYYDDSELFRWDEGWTEEEIFDFRKLVMEMVLATDMSRHFELLGRFKAKIAECCDGVDFQNHQEKLTVMMMALKASDIGSQTKGWPLARKWANFVQEEFYMQGDKEKDLGLICSPLCDRDEVDIVKSQLGFIDAVLFPLFVPIAKVLPALDNIISQLDYNRSMWDKELKTREALERDSSGTDFSREDSANTRMSSSSINE